MARDYRKRPASSGKGAQPRKKNGGSVPAWVWMLGGFLPGLFLAALVHLHHERAGDTALTSGKTLNAGEAPVPGDGDDSRPRFEFYKLLSEMEVVVPDEPEEPRQRASAEPAIPTTPRPPSSGSSTPGTDSGVQYLVQAGSFKNHADADRLKARLALMGVEAKIQSVQIHGGETWHRVRIGPMGDRSRMDAVRKRLEQEKVESILLRLQG